MAQARQGGRRHPLGRAVPRPSDRCPGVERPGRRCLSRGAHGQVSEFLPFLVIGLATGSVYAIAAMGLTVTYTTSGVFNFAHGAVGMIASFVFYTLRVDLGVPTVLAMAVAVLGVGPVIG